MKYNDPDKIDYNKFPDPEKAKAFKELMDDPEISQADKHAIYAALLLAKAITDATSPGEQPKLVVKKDDNNGSLDFNRINPYLN